MTQLELGLIRFQKGDFQGAAMEFEGHLLDEPGSTQALLFAGICQMRLRSREAAEEKFRLLLELEPGNYDALAWLAEVLRQKGDLKGAIRFGLAAYEADDSRAEAFAILGSLFLATGEAGEAVKFLEKACAASPLADQHHHYLGLAYGVVQRPALAEKHLRRAIELAPNNPQNYFALAGRYIRFGLAAMALDVLTQGLHHCPNSAMLHTQAASAFTLLRNEQAAEGHHRRAIELSTEAESSYALWLTDQGRFNEAAELYKRLIARNPDSGLGYYGLFQSNRTAQEDPHLLEKAEVVASDERIKPMSRMYAHYALAKREEQCHRYGEAMGHYDEANRLAYLVHSPQAPFDLESIQREGELVRRSFRLLPELANSLQRGPKPIMIVGMIRSGTTLLDQIISSHPDVASAGELRFWIEKSIWLSHLPEEDCASAVRELSADYLGYIDKILSPGKAFTDKMPLNIFYAGVINRVLPMAKIIHIHRNPVDTCLSIYSNYLGSGTQFAYHKGHIVQYYREYEVAAAYWKGQLPSDHYLEIDYRQLVLEKEKTVRHVIDFCELEWSDRCLHHEENRSAINTPSRWQARQPVYTGSLDRWKKYEPWLGEFATLCPTVFSA